MDAYCNRRNLAQNSTRFLYNDKQICPTETPLELEMEDDDEIAAIHGPQVELESAGQEGFSVRTLLGFILPESLNRS